MSLPTEWTDKIFKKLTLIYGREFSARWEGMSIADVKTDWSHELSGYEHRPKSIAWALQNLPSGRPPTVLEFRRLANTLPAESAPAIEHQKASAERVAAELLKLAPLRKRTYMDNRDWARRIVARHEQGDRIMPYSLKLAQSALKMNLLGAA